MKKKNDALAFIVYALMLAIAAVVGFVLIRPVFTSDANYGQYLEMNGILFVLIAIVTGILANALLLEIGHLIGAKIGKYKIVQWTVFGLGVKYNKDKKKMRFAISDFDGLTGETKVIPTDVQKSDPRHIIYAPLVVFLLEILGLTIGIVAVSSTNNPAMAWPRMFMQIVLAVGGMIHLYNIFPARLDAKNDGYLLPILSKHVNRVAYNIIIDASVKMGAGKEISEITVFDQVTSFTSEVNRVAAYAKLKAHDYAAARDIFQKTIACEKDVSSAIFADAVAQVTALNFMIDGLDAAKEKFIDLDVEQKRHIAALKDAASLRAYILASGLAEESVGETETALSKVKYAIKKSDASEKAIEEDLIKEAVAKVYEAHPDWDFYDYGYPNPKIKHVEESPSDEETKE